MKVVQIGTIILEDLPNVLFVELLTDDGLVGLGETFLGARAVEKYVHETVAPYLLGRDPLEIERHHSALGGYVGVTGSGAEVRGNSAIDIALWDILGQSAGQPLYQLLGGAFRSEARIYNTCAGPGYMKDQPSGVGIDNWGLPAGGPARAYEDLYAFFNHADELARDLLAEGVTAMKIWPFDPYVPYTNGHGISAENLAKGLGPLRKIRDAVGRNMDVMVELHGLWDVPTAKRIGHALLEFEPLWVEDPLRAEYPAALAEVAREIAVPIATGETIGGLVGFNELLRHGAASTVIFDIGWCGGVTTARKVAALVESHQLPVAPHDCTGPVVLAASVHMSVSLPNAGLQETVRAMYRTWYADVVTELPKITGGSIAPTTSPGLGLSLQPDVKRRAGTTTTTSKLGEM